MKDIILAPVVTEKTAGITADGNKVVFKVAKEAFNVKVSNVNTINVRPKKKRVGRYTGATKAYKKAIITLAEGSKLDLS